MTAEKHILYPTGAGTTQEVQQAMYHFINNWGSTVGLRIAQDGATYATHNGTALGTPDNTVGWWGLNSYFVIEPVATMPGGGRWQCKIQRVSTTVLSAMWAPIGGWLTSAQTFSPNPVSALTQWNDAVAPGANATYYISGSNMETYAAGVSTYGYTYFRVLIRRSNGAEDSQFVSGLYVGGYVPNEPTLDLQPSCMLAQQPRLSVASTSWSYTTANASCLNRAPIDNTHTATDYTNNGHCFTSSNVLGTYAKTRSGLYANKPMYLYNIAGAYELGYFGNYTMFAGALQRTDATPDSANEYLVANEIMHRWKPSA